MASTSLAVRIASVICALVAAFLAFLTLGDVALFGFPDSHVTDYEQAARGPLTVAGWVQAGLGVALLVLAFVRISLRARVISWLVAVIGLVLATVAVQKGVPWYYGTHLGLDNGIGG